MPVAETGPSARPVGGRALGAATKLSRWAGRATTPASLIWLGLVLVVPIATVLARSIGEPRWQAYRELFSDSTITTIAVRTVVLALIATAFTVALGFPVAYALVLVGPRLRGALFILLIFPYITSLLVRSYAWIGILGINGPVSRGSQLLGLGERSYVGTSVGVVLTLIHVFLPFVILSTYVSMRRIDPTQVRAGESLGANRLEVFWTVFAPQARPGVLAGGLLVFVVSVGMYAIPALIGGPNQTTVAMVIVQQVTAGYGLPQDRPAALAVLLCALVVVLLAVGGRAVGLATLLGVEGRERTRPSVGRRARALRRSVWAQLASLIPQSRRTHHLSVIAAVVTSLVIVVGPFIFLVGISFQPLPLIQFPTKDFSLRWYEAVLNDPAWITAARNSLQIGVVASLMAVVIGGYLASLTLRLRRFGASALMGVTLAPLVVPTVMYATGAYIVFVQFDFIGNWLAIAVAHSVLALPYAYINMLNGLSSYDRRLDDAARSMGASAWRRVAYVTLPVLRPAILSGAFLAFLVSLDEFVTTLFLSGVSYTTLPLAFWSASRDNLSPALAVVGVLMVLLVSAVGLLGYLARGRTFNTDGDSAKKGVSP